MKHSILCVDDEVDNVDALERLFRRKYNVFKATSAQQALDLLDKNPVTVIISDQRMPQMTGVELLAKSIDKHPHAIRILLTGYTDIDSVISAINAGQIYRYVTKPWDPVDLANAVDKAIERFEIGEELVEKNQALQNALEELQTLDQAKNQFMILVNHELKTPLTSMLSFTDLLNETKLSPDQGRMLARIKGAANKLQEMINDALEFVSAETSQMKLDIHPVSSRALFSQAVVPEPMQTLAFGKRLRLEFEIDDCPVMADEKVLNNVFRRLLHNAIKFSDLDSPVRIVGQKRLGAYHVSIINKGPPIDEKRVAQLMKPFTLNENTLNHSVGTGLGLSIAHSMLKLHGSMLRLMSGNAEVQAQFSLKLAVKK